MAQPIIKLIAEGVNCTLEAYEAKPGTLAITLYENGLSHKPGHTIELEAAPFLASLAKLISK